MQRSREGPAMNAEPFFTFPVRGKEDAIRVRHHARHIASLLRFPPLEQACIAAGTFALVAGALRLLGPFEVCFRLADGHLHVNVAADVAGLMRLAKPLPSSDVPAPEDLAWLVCRADFGSHGLFEEVAKQNQEVLALLHELCAARQPK